VSQEIRDFASRELALPENRSYRSFADLDRQYVVWNVVAAPSRSLEPRTWCYLFAGCAAYRGYFSERAARRHGDRLAADGYDVRVAGVAAYSTLGWFADPVLNTFLDYADADLAALIFHDLAPPVVFVTADSSLTESLAPAAAVAGVRRWLGSQGRAEDLAVFEQGRRRRNDLNRFLRGVRTDLEAIYAREESDERKLARKTELFRSLPARWRSELAAERPAEADGGSGGRADSSGWLARLNNADLVSVATYNDLVEEFLALLEAVDGDFPTFHAEVRRLAALPSPERRRELELTRPGGQSQR